MPAPLLITDTEVTGVLKRVYSGIREDMFPKITPLLANVRKAVAGGASNLRWGGDGVYGDAVLTRPVGMTASDAGYFPPDADASERQFKLDIKRLYVTRQIDGLAIVGTQNKEQAFVSLARKILTEARSAAELGMQEVLHGNGNAIKAIVSSAADTTHCVVTSPYGIVGAGQGGLLLDVGMYCAVKDTTGVTTRGKATISAIVNSGDNATITWNAAIAGQSATDIIVPATTSDDAYAAYPNGLTNIVNRGGSYATLHTLSGTTWPRWDTTRLVAGTDTPDANQPSESDVWELATRVYGRSGKNAKTNPKEFLLLSTPGIEKKLAESFLGQRRFTPEGMMDIEGGYKAVNICGIPLVSDIWCPSGTLYLVHLPSLLWVDAKDWGQVEYEGAGPWRWITGRDAFETSFATYIQFGTRMRIAHGMITGYTDSNRYTFVM